VSPGVGGRWAEGASTPPGGFPPSPAQAGRASSIARAGDRAVLWLCSWAVLVAEVDERRPVQVNHSRRAASSPTIRLGLAIQPRARVVKGRWKPVPQWRHRGPGGRLLITRILEPGEAQAELGWRAGEGGTRRGKASWFQQSPLLLTMRRGEVEPGGESWVRPKGRAQYDGCDRGRQRLCYELGVRKKTPPPGDSARRSFGRCSTRTAPGPR